MKRSQLLLLLGAVLLTAGLLYLPTGILRNAGKANAPGATANRDGKPGAAGSDSAAGPGPAFSPANAPKADAPGLAPLTPEHPHREVSAAEQATLAKLRKAFRASASPNARAGSAAELAGQLAQTQQYDSAGFYYEQAALARPGEKYELLAANQYFEAFGFAATPQRGKELATKAQTLYGAVLKNNPANLDAKTNLAMTYVASPAPMQGVLLLREVLATDPTNAPALYNLGMLSMQSGQMEKAVGRFLALVKAHPDHLNGNFYLGVTLAQTKQPAEARRAFEKTLALSPDPQLKAAVEQELAKLK